VYTHSVDKMNMRLNAAVVLLTAPCLLSGCFANSYRARGDWVSLGNVGDGNQWEIDSSSIRQHPDYAKCDNCLDTEAWVRVSTEQNALPNLAPWPIKNPYRSIAQLYYFNCAQGLVAHYGWRTYSDPHWAHPQHWSSKLAHSQVRYRKPSTAGDSAVVRYVCAPAPLQDITPKSAIGRNSAID
jgi:hypothetical protein